MISSSPIPLVISIIIPTYNQESVLELILLALAEQKYDHCKCKFEVIIADDGSTVATRNLLSKLCSASALPYPLQHVWHEDKGFRAAMIRNRAVAVASGDYLIFLDGDCIPRSSFVQQHALLAESGWFVVGQRVLLSKNFTTTILSSSSLSPLLHHWSVGDWLIARLHGKCNRFLSFIVLPALPHCLRFLQVLRKLWPHKWQGAKTCNLAMWKGDFWAISGFDESYTGWGYEDSDLVIRLINNGVRRKSGRFAVTVFCG